MFEHCYHYYRTHATCIESLCQSKPKKKKKIYFVFPSKQSILHVGRSFWSSALHVYSTYCCDSKKLHIDSLNKQERVSPSLYGHYNTIAFQCFNTNSKRSLSPLFFHRETQKTRDRLHWCIDHWFLDPSILWLCLNIATHYYRTHATCIESLCQSKPTKKKKKRFEWAKHCRFCAETREMTCCVMLWWPLLVGWWEKPA